MKAFTLIELSIVLVVIGLVVGGVLVGRDLIAAAAVRAQISQIEKYQQAVNAFRGKYGYLPGDIKDPEASQFGLGARGQYAGEGDGNGVIEGNNTNNSGLNNGFWEATGETVMFWVDLNRAILIEGGFAGTATTWPSINPVRSSTNPSVGAYFPAARIGDDTYLMVYSQGGANFHHLGANLYVQQNGPAYTGPGITVVQAFSIDSKIDDGLPQTGAATSVMMVAGGLIWATGGGGTSYPLPTQGGLGTNGTQGTANTCYDNGWVNGAVQQYSVAQNRGAGMNCALSFKFQ